MAEAALSLKRRHPRWGAIRVLLVGLEEDEQEIARLPPQNLDTETLTGVNLDDSDITTPVQLPLPCFVA